MDRNHKYLHNPPKGDEIEISIFGPGYGECIVIHIGNGRWLIVDSCICNKSKKPIAEMYLDQLGIDLSTQVEYLICSHWHDDHIRGFSGLVDTCSNAQVCISSALHVQDFYKLLSSYSEDLVATAPGTIEISKTFDILLNRDSPMWVTQDRPILNDFISINDHEKIPIKIVALSPSDQSITAAKLSFKELLPEINQAQRGITSINPNHSSVVTYIEIGDISLLLGSDLENTGRKDSGWDCIIDNLVTSINKSLIYKVSHHGSLTGDHDKIWSELLEGEPISILTPFNRGRVSLPKDSDRERLMLKKGRTFLSSCKEQSGKIKRKRTVQKTMHEATRFHSLMENNTGFITLRNTIGKNDWTITLSDNAIELQEA